MEQRITIVDDEGEVRSALRRLFKVAGIKTQSYASAEEFLDAPSGRSCDCLILDHGLPGMSGLELQSRLAASHRGLPIIFVSARDDAHTRAQAMQAGALAFLGKPFSDEVLLRAVRTALQLTRS
jgi:two-component system, LuxR family, response regulator FixJ